MIPSRSRKLRILLAEDNPDDEFLLREAFGELGVECEIVVATDGEEARAIVQPGGRFSTEAAPDVILVDYHLPKYDGREVLVAIRANPALQTVPVAVLSSSLSAADSEEATRLGATRYIQKPSSLEELESVCRAILEMCAGISEP